MEQSPPWYHVPLRACWFLCALAIVVAGCAGQSAHVVSSSGPAAAPDAAQVLRMPLLPGHSLGTLDPALELDSSAGGILQLIWPTLVTVDQTGEPHPWAAESIDISSDGLEYTFHLHPGLIWSDGTPLDAKAFAFSLNRLLDPCTGSRLGYFLYPLKDAYTFNNESCVQGAGSTPAVSGQIKTLLNDAIIASDPTTLVLKLAQPSSYFLTELSDVACAAVPEQLISRYGGAWTSHLAGATGFGANMFMVTTWASGHTLILTRNPHFFGTQPLLREIDVSLGDTVSAAYSAFQSGKLDVGYAPAAAYAGARGQNVFHTVGDLTLDYFAMSWHIAPFNDVRMRQAFALALNKQSLVQSVFQGTAIPTNHIVPSGVLGYNPALTGPDGKPSVTGNVVKAQQLEESYVQSTCGGNVSQCPAVTLTIPNGNSQEAAMAKAGLAEWQAAFPGYPVSVASIDYTTFLDDLIGNVTTPALQFWAAYWVADYPDPQDWLSLQFLPSSAYNSSGVNLAAANSLMIRADGETETTARILDYQAAEQLLVNQVAWVPLDQEKVWWESAPYVEGYLVAPSDQTPLLAWQDIYIAHH
jgi:oligopeptide transport system substrate-binding protein